MNQQPSTQVFNGRTYHETAEGWVLMPLSSREAELEKLPERAVLCDKVPPNALALERATHVLRCLAARGLPLERAVPEAGGGVALYVSGDHGLARIVVENDEGLVYNLKYEDHREIQEFTLEETEQIVDMICRCMFDHPGEAEAAEAADRAAHEEALRKQAEQDAKITQDFLDMVAFETQLEEEAKRQRSTSSELEGYASWAQGILQEVPVSPEDEATVDQLMRKSKSLGKTEPL